MFFRNKKNRQPQRTRQPTLGSSSVSRPVFSYHANSARTDRNGGRSKVGATWQAPENPPATRLKPKVWSRRVPVVAAVILTVVLVGSNLPLSSDPEIIPLVGSDNRQVFLRSTEVYHEAARSVMAASLVNTNKLTVDSGDIAKTLQKEFPELEHVVVALPVIGRQAAIYIQPARPALLLKTSDGGVYVVDMAGRALINASQASKAQKLKLMLVEDQSGLQTELGRTILPSDVVAFITEVVGQLKAKNIHTTSIVLPRATNELDIRLEGSPYIVKFNLRGDAREEVGAYLAVRKHLQDRSEVPASHIDVRVDNKAYYQ